MSVSRGDTMPAYLIANVNVQDPATFEQYRKQVPATIAKHGGRYLVRGGRVERLEGSWNPTRLVVLEFPSMEQAGRLSVDTMADAVGALLARLGEPPAHVVGLSLGGCVGLALALRAPDRVRSLTLVNAVARLRPAGPTAALRLVVRLTLLATAPM